MTAATATRTYRPIPVGELLEQLRADGFVVTPDTYRRVFAVVDAFFPNGLPVREDGQFIDSSRDELGQLLGPVIARNEAEQDRFANRFAQSLAEPELPNKPKEPVSQVTKAGDRDSKPLATGRIAQIILLILTGGWLIGLGVSKSPPTSKADISVTTVDWQTRSFQLDSLSASRVDTVWWDFGDDTRFAIAEAGPVTHTYSKAGDYQISASWRSGSGLDSARIMTKIVDDDLCRLDFAVFSIGNSYTFVNQSPGLRAGFTYRFDFGDGTPPAVGKNDSVTHTYADDSRQYAITLTTLASGCSNSSTQQLGEAPFTPTFVGLRRMPYRHFPQFALLWWLPFVLIGSGATVAGLILMGWFRRQHRPQPPNSGPPYELTFPDQSAGIRVGASMDDWAQQLQQRDEGSRRLLDVSRTVLATARRGGYPTVAYRRMKSRPRYVVLIDHRSAQHQQAHLYSFLTTVLIESDVEVEPFYFHTDPRYCWNETYPQGLTIETLYRLHATSNLVLITEGTRLVDYENQALASWVADLLGGWANRAILTPVYPENWNVIEAILTEFFVVLPATPDGQLLLRSYFQMETLPTFADLRQTFGVTGMPEGRGVFSKTPSTLTLADVRAFLNKSFPTETSAVNHQELLWQWACATAVYPTPNYDVTVAIGKAIEDYTGTNDLVTTSNLLKLTALPHLKQSTIPDDLQDALLAELPAEIDRVARRAVLKLLSDPNHQPPAGSRAETDRNLQRWMQWLQSDDPGERQKALRELRPYQQAGYITNRRARAVVEQAGKRQRQRYSLGLTLLTTVLMGLTAFWPAQPPQTQVAGSMRWAYAELPSTTDSAAYYNNRAVGRLDTARTTTTYASTVTRQYESALRELTQSLRHRISADALQNLHALRYDRALASRSWLPSIRAQRLPEKTLSPLGEVRTLMAPIRRLDPVWVPTDSTLMQYMFQIATNAPTADVYALLTTKGKTEFNQQSAGQAAIIGAGKDTTGFARLVIRAQRSYNIAHINMLVRQTKTAGPNVLRIRLNDTTAIRLSTLDRLLPLEASRILLCYNGPKDPIVIRATPVAASAIVKKPLLSSGKKRSQNRLPKPPVKGPSGGQKNPPAAVNQPGYSPITTVRVPGATSPTYSLTSVSVKWDNAANNPVSRRGLTEPYGVLIGSLVSAKVGEDGIVYLLVTAKGESYRVALDLSSQVADQKSPSRQTQKQNAILGKEGTGQTSGNSPRPDVAYKATVFSTGFGEAGRLRAYQLFKESSPGFYPLERSDESGALDYVRGVKLSQKSRTIQAANLVAQLVSAAPSPSKTSQQTQQTPASEELDTKRILIWGSRWQPKEDDQFGLSDFYELHNIHLNQGYTGEKALLNAPWQDGGIIMNEYTRGGAVAYLILLTNQTLNVDDNGDPLSRGPTAK